MNTSPQLAPQSAFAPRHDPTLGLYAPPANHWLRMLYAALLRIKCLRECLGDIVSEEAVVLGDDLTDIRAADPLAAATYVYNSGNRAAYIFEAGAVVGRAEAQSGLALPQPGLLAISAKEVGVSEDPTTSIGYLFSKTYDAEADTTAILIIDAEFPTDTQPGEQIEIDGSLYDILETSFSQAVVAGEVVEDLETAVFLRTRAIVSTTTQRRCLCGDAEYYDADPVGAFLL